MDPASASDTCAGPPTRASALPLPCGLHAPRTRGPRLARSRVPGCPLPRRVRGCRPPVRSPHAHSLDGTPTFCTCWGWDCGLQRREPGHHCGPACAAAGTPQDGVSCPVRPPHLVYRGTRTTSLLVHTCGQTCDQRLPQDLDSALHGSPQQCPHLPQHLRRVLQISMNGTTGSRGRAPAVDRHPWAVASPCTSASRRALQRHPRESRCSRTTSAREGRSS